MKWIGSTILVLFLFPCAFAQEAWKIEEFGNVSCDYLLSEIDVFFNELKISENAKGYIFIYEGRVLFPLFNKQNKTVYPLRSVAKAEIKNIKDHIKFRDFDKNQVVIIEGGFRERYTVELWIVPFNATPPKPTPTLKKMKYRKGKAEPSCKYI